jgi:hypothetical protein
MRAEMTIKVEVLPEESVKQVQDWFRKNPKRKT